jgi:hypothetical protein
MPNTFVLIWISRGVSHTCFSHPQKSLHQFEDAKKNYEKALSLLPDRELSAKEKRQRMDYTDQVLRCETSMTGHLVFNKELGEMPYARAAAMIDELAANGNFVSSVRQTEGL